MRNILSGGSASIASSGILTNLQGIIVRKSWVKIALSRGVSRGLLRVVLLLGMLMCGASCSRRVVIADSKQAIRLDGIRLKPFYKVRKSNSKVLNTVLGTGLGAGVGWFWGVVMGGEQVKPGKFALIGGGVALGLTVPFAIFEKKQLRYVEEREIGDWLKKYNRRHGSSYELAFYLDGYCYLSREGQKYALIQEYRNEINESARKQRQRANEGMAFLFLLIGAAEYLDQVHYVPQSACSCNGCGGTGRIHWKKYLKNQPEVSASSKEYYDCNVCDGSGKKRGCTE